MVVLNASESRRLLAKATVALPDTFFVRSAADFHYDSLAQLATLKGI